MDPTRLMKTRSVGPESKSHPRSSGSERPGLGNRAYSSSTAERGKQNRPNARESDKLSAVQDRDSKTSNRDDPFFRTYQMPQPVRLAEKSHRIHRPSNPNEPAKHGIISQINLAILGALGVGKSTFVQKALDLRHHPVSHYSSKKMSLDNVVYLVRLLEISMEEIMIADDRKVQWPSNVSDRDMPSVDGVLVLYDVTNPESIQGVPEILNALSSSAIPFMLVSCKCDHPPQLRQIAPGLFRQSSGLLNGIDAHQTSANVPESQKRCISIILRQILARSSEYSRQRGTALSKSRPIASDKIDSAKSPTSPRAVRHQQTSSEDVSNPSEAPLSSQLQSPLKPLLEKRSKSLIESDVEPEPENLKQLRQLTEKSVDDQIDQAAISEYLVRQPLKLSPQDDINVDGVLPASQCQDPEVLHSHTSNEPSQHEAAERSNIVPYNSFLHMEDDLDVSLAHNAKVNPLLEIEKLKVSVKPVTITGDSMDELVDRLLNLPMSKQEAKFVPIFLCLYRKFAAPAQLLALVIKRFDDEERGPDAQLIRIGEQLRFLQVLSQWARDYPNDFAQTTVRNQAQAFVARLEKNRVFAYTAKELRCHLERSTDGADEEGWTSFEKDPFASSEDNLLPSDVSTADVRNASSSTLADSKEDLRSKKSWTSSQDEAPFARHSLNLSQTSSTIGQSQVASTSNQSLPAVDTSQEEARREAAKLVPIPRRPLSKMIWRRFMEISDEDFARELTRIDWVMYSSIRPRDLIRHVSLANVRQTTKEKSTKSSRSLRNVDRMIDHFNHLTLFVAAMILFRDKPKHRAQALEKFMSISWKLRQMNNYNSLGALLAGINNSTVTRLAETWALIPQQTSKQFMRLNILMGSAKSHFAYRLAWENSFAERIPFIPLHRRDLVAAEDGNKTFVGPNGDRINWKKFEVMGEVVIGIQKSQDKPYTFSQRNLEVGWMVLETRILEGDEDSMDPFQELHERSVTLEPGRGYSDAGRKNWFKR